MKQKNFKNGGKFTEKDFELVKMLTNRKIDQKQIARVTGWSVTTISWVSHSKNFQDYQLQRTEAQNKHKPNFVLSNGNTDIMAELKSISSKLDVISEKLDKKGWWK